LVSKKNVRKKLNLFYFQRASLECMLKTQYDFCKE